MDTCVVKYVLNKKDTYIYIGIILSQIELTFQENPIISNSISFLLQNPQ